MEEQRTTFQKAVLILLAAMIVVFGVITGFNQSRKGIVFEEGFLRKEEVTDADWFTGKVQGEEVSILRWRGIKNGARTVTLRVGERVRDVYTVYLGKPMIPLSGVVSGVASGAASSRSLAPEIPTLRIMKNDEVLFEGGYQENSGFFFTPEGEWTSLGLSMSTYVSGADLWENYTMPKGFLVQLALNPELENRGDWRLYGLVVLFTLLTMADVAFPYTLFRWRHRRWVKDPEPTDDYMSMQHLAWLIAVPILLGFYIWASMTLAAVV